MHRTAAAPTPFRRLLSSSLIGLAAAAAAILGAPPQGAGHTASSPVAADGLARVEALGPGLAGAEARVLGGDQRLWLRVEPPLGAVVLGYADEPFLRFSDGGVAVNRRSPTARVAGVVPAGDPVGATAGPPDWSPLTSAHAYAWHDHRLRPAPGGAAGAASTRAWSVPVVVDGRLTAVSGSVRSAPPPALWPWLLPLGVAAAGVGLLLAGRRAAAASAAIPALAVCALASGLTSFVGRSLTDEGGPAGRWPGTSAAVALGVVLMAAIAARWSGRRPAAIVAGVIGASEGLAMLGAFRHGLVLSALPAELARTFAALALLAGVGAVVVAIAAAGWARPAAAARRGALAGAAGTGAGAGARRGRGR